MSDFDKEAEREKLREKYERDKQEREATQRMSDLLLKGARMTNTHCNTCGDPLFQQNGTTFCPSCHGTAEGVEASVADQSAEEDARGTDASDGQTASPESNSADPATAEGASGTVDAPESGPEPTESVSNDRSTGSRATPAQPRNEPEPSNANETAAQPSDARDEPFDRSRTPSGDRSSRDPAGNSRSSPAPVDGDLEVAQDALVESLERFARKAAETDDPRYAKECLEAAREASEALSALR
ncbi:Sjogren's syndrome/scleroderma autoantigen 1 family protein [Halostagnicola sp. A-GB9-2]|uniref:Sjogren's syndrome/scleroderma autoantigen 1 family protein n=1 Tax=Halostagnicola sp. A-GB9-2 TaxID=3048066 RepID=UPI0024BF53B1|nr:Sjogren's syndrome/scleroderma autoantigen 1 family protein [Halostagnicola sp. A-GB9-2]MDJ1432802.1 Sjogren's syndrome/scleroderma autoantigen 1 family protein [Halostagnicola sp. A-GB9-2]